MGALSSDSQLPDSESEDLSEVPRVLNLHIEGHKNISTSNIREVLHTKTVPRWKFWKKDHDFLAGAWEKDLERVAILYRQKGYYHARISGTVAEDRDEHRVDLTLHIEEGEPTRIRRLQVHIAATTSFSGPLESATDLPLKEGSVFTQQDYQATQARLTQHWNEKSHAWVEISRRAQVELRSHSAEVNYDLELGVPARFGDIVIEGLEKVHPDLVRREYQFAGGDTFSRARLNETRQRLLRLGLFKKVQCVVHPESPEQEIVPVTIEVREGPPRHLRTGLGYDTDEAFRGFIQWSHRNFLGRGYLLSLETHASQISQSLKAQLAQPHFFHPEQSLTWTAIHELQNETNYELTRTGLRTVWSRESPASRFDLSAGLRSHYLSFSDVSTSVTHFLSPDVGGWDNGPDLQLVRYHTASKPSLFEAGIKSVWSFEHSSPLFDSDYSYNHLEATLYSHLRLSRHFLLAERWSWSGLWSERGDNGIPLSRRLYAGGDQSVRGYRRRNIGPRTSQGDILGGKSMLEGSHEIRYLLKKQWLLATFLDHAALGFKSGSLPVQNSEHAFGFGAGYITGVGLIRADLAFPV